MSKQPHGIKHPDEDPKLAWFDPIRRLTGGETPEERIARVEEEQRQRPLRILDGLRRKRRH